MTDPRQAQEEIIEEFSLFDDWMDRYQYLIDLGRALPEFPEAHKTEENRLHGCQSQVWMTVEGDADQLEFHAISDSAIVCGLIALLLRVYSGASAQEIVSTEPKFIEAIGLKSHLSPTRSNGLFAMLQAIRGHGAQALEAHAGGQCSGGRDRGAGGRGARVGASVSRGPSDRPRCLSASIPLIPISWSREPFSTGSAASGAAPTVPGHRD